MADSVDFLSASAGFEPELTRIQHSLVSGCFMMTPAKSTDSSPSSSCWMMYRIPMSASLTDRLSSPGPDVITCASMFSAKAHIVDINHCRPMDPSRLTEVSLSSGLAGDNVEVTARFSLEGGLREAFNEEGWTRAYDANDVSFKLKYTVRLTSGGIRKRELGRPVDTYRKASIFWTRNPKLVNPMKERRIWVQVAKNFEPFVVGTEEEVRRELFDFEERFVFRASDLGPGTHKLSAEASASWQKHLYTDPGSARAPHGEIEITI